ncbi:MAG TPA: MFS transporter [Candidatus Dormibacteraeota bacterium]|nr:MFS transporter [Candidatus Dormibacteraeota bacterium]
MPDRHSSLSSSASSGTPGQPVTSPEPFSAVNARAEWARLHSGFVYIGVVTILLGPLLPYLARHWSLSDSQAGFLFTAEYSGSALGNLLTGLLLPRIGFTRVMGTSFLLFVLGFSFLGAGSWTLACLLIFLYGIAMGLAVPASNLRATQMPSANTAAAVSLLNFSWGIGAVLCPFLIAALLPSIGLRGFTASLAGFALIFSALYFARPRTAREHASRLPGSSPRAWFAQLRQVSAVPLLLLFFLYVGVESALGGWVAAYEKRMPGMVSSTWALAPLFFYLFLLIGRGFAPLVLRRLSQRAISAGGLVCAVAGAGIIAHSHSPLLLYGGTAIAGFGLAPQYPLYVTWFAKTFREDANWLGALYFGGAGLGGAVLPWLVGIIAAHTNSLRAGLILPAAVTAVMVILSLRAHPRSAPA